jgi:hypothetical protein
MTVATLMENTLQAQKLSAIGLQWISKSVNFGVQKFFRI